MRFVSLSGSNFGSLVYQFGWSERRFSFLAEPSNKAICDEQTNTSAGSQGLRRKNVFEPFLLRPTVTDVGTDVLCSQKVTERILVLILMLVLRSEIPSGMCAKLRTVAASNNRVHMPWSLDYCLFTSHIWVMFFAHIPFVVNHTFNATPIGRLQQHPLLFTMNRTDRTFFCVKAELSTTCTSWLQHHFIAIGKAQGACVQSFAPWQEVTRVHARDHYYCLFAPHVYIIVLRAHPVCGESHNQRNVTREVATLPFRFT